MRSGTCPPRREIQAVRIKATKASATGAFSAALFSVAKQLPIDYEFGKKKPWLVDVADRWAQVLFLTELFRGMALTLEYFFRPKATLNYPMEKGPISSRYVSEYMVSSWEKAGKHHEERN